MKLWVGQTISLFGSSITILALPLTAVLMLHATAFQMGILTAATNAPFLIVGLFAGVVVDRSTRRPILLIADLGRALLLLLIPIAALSNLLRIEYLYIIALLVGTLTVFFDVSYYSYLPSLIGHEQLIEGNSKLEASSSLAQIAGPGLAGGLVQLFTAPVAIVIDALSFLVSVVSLALIHVPEQPPSLPKQQRKVWVEIGEGIRLVGSNPLLRAITICGAIHNFASSMLSTVLLLYMTRELGIQPAVIGGIFAAGSCGSLVGALVGGRVSVRFGVGPMIVGAQVLTGIASLFYPLALGVSTIATTLVLMVGQVMWGLSRPIFNINQMSLRQAITPYHLLGRTNATIRFISWGAMAVGGIAGGALGEMIGIQSVLGVVSIGEFLAVLWVLFSSVRLIREPQLHLDEHIEQEKISKR
jgi:MFS family permease